MIVLRSHGLHCACLNTYRDTTPKFPRNTCGSIHFLTNFAVLYNFDQCELLDTVNVVASLRFDIVKSDMYIQRLAHILDCKNPAESQQSRSAKLGVNSPLFLVCEVPKSKPKSTLLLSNGRHIQFYFNEHVVLVANHQRGTKCMIRRDAGFASTTKTQLRSDRCTGMTQGKEAISISFQSKQAFPILQDRLSVDGEIQFEAATRAFHERSRGLSFGDW